MIHRMHTFYRRYNAARRLAWALEYGRQQGYDQAASPTSLHYQQWRRVCARLSRLASCPHPFTHA